MWGVDMRGKIQRGIKPSWGLGVLLAFSFALSVVLVPAHPAHSQVNSPPSFSSPAYQLASSENPTQFRPVGEPVVATDPDPHDKLTYTLAGEDANYFTVAETSGQLETREPLDYESRASYLIEVRATDSGGLYDTASVNISVTNIDEAGSIVLTPITTDLGAGAQATLTDPDGSLSDVSWQWSVSSDKTTWRNIEGAVSASYVPREEDLRQFLQVRATYGDGHGTGKQATRSFDASLLPGANNPPEFPFSESGVRRIAADLPSGARVGGPVLAGDLDGDPLTYGLSGAAAQFLEIGSHTGQLRTTINLHDRLEGRHFGEVHVFDGRGGTVSKVVRVDVGYIVASAPASAPESGGEADSTLTPLGVTTEVTEADSGTGSPDSQQAQPQLQASHGEPEPGFNSLTGSGPIVAGVDYSQAPAKSEAAGEPKPEDQEEPLAAAMASDSPPPQPLAEGTQAGAVGPSGGSERADVAEEGGLGSLFKWIAWISLAALLLAGVLLLLLKLKRDYRREVSLPPPTLGPERRIGSLPFIMSRPDGSVASPARNAGPSESGV